MGGLNGRILKTHRLQVVTSFHIMLHENSTFHNMLDLTQYFNEDGKTNVYHCIITIQAGAKSTATEVHNYSKSLRRWNIHKVRNKWISINLGEKLI